MQLAERRTEDLLLYGWGFLVSAAGASAVLLDMQSPALTVWSLVLLVGGFAASWRLRDSRISQSTVGLVIAATLLACVLAGGRGLQNLIEGQARIHGLGNEELLALLMLLLMILRSFALYTRGDVAFCIVPGIAVFGLLAGIRAAPSNVVAFVIFLFASICLASHEHYLSQREQAGVHAVGSERTQWMVVVSGLSLVVLALGFVTTLATSRMAIRVPMVVMPKRVPAGPAPKWLGLTSGSFLEPTATVAIGTGPVELSDLVIFTVEAEEPEYWRMRTYEKYTGRGWETGKRPASRPGVRGVFELPRPAEWQALKRVRQTFTFQVRSTALVGAPQPVRYDLGEKWAPVVRYLTVDDSGGARLTGLFGLRPYSEYGVVSLVPPPVRIPTDGAEPRMPDVGAEFLRVPFDAQKEVDPLAKSITAGIPTAAGKVLALRDYVAKHGKYDINAPAVPSGEDVVAYFLQSPEPKAYCDVYASALAVLCRAAGVPSRFAVGFSPGQFDSEWGSTVVRENDRHAWAEVYIPGQGWTPVEATPSPQGRQARTAAAAETGPGSRLPRFIALFLAVPAVLAAAWLVWLRRLIPALFGGLKKSRQPAGPRASLIQFYARVLRLLARHGLRRKASQTPLEYLAHVRASAGHVLGGWLDSLAELTQDFMDARYSARPVAMEQVERARATVRQGEQELRRNRRLLRRPT